MYIKEQSSAAMSFETGNDFFAQMDAHMLTQNIILVRINMFYFLALKAMYIMLIAHKRMCFLKQNMKIDILLFIRKFV